MNTARQEFPPTIPAAMARAARLFGDASAIEEQGYHASFRELERESLRAAAAFLACGLRKGDRVALWAPNCAEWVVAALGAQSAGAVIVPLNTRFRGKEAGYILRRSRARLLLTVGEFLGVHYTELLTHEALPDLERIVMLRGASAGHQGWREFLALGADVPEARVIAARDAIGPDDLSDLLFTSGTTGDPKGVMSAHGPTVQTFSVWSDTVGLRPGDRYMIVNPFFHTFGYKSGWLACLLRGATILPVAVFDAGEVMRRIVEDRVTVLPGAPTLFQSMLAHESCGKIDLSSLRVSVTGAATVPPILIERMRKVLGFQTVVTAYGLTEAPVVTICPPGTSDERVAQTCGKAIPGVEVRCVDDAGRVVPTGEPGEVLVRGFNVMRGYFEDPAATAKAIDAGGWLHTGDIGVLDEEGFLRITDRKKDLFIVGGFNCYPAEIEKILSEHPAIAQAAVIGVPDERMGEVGKAFVVLRPGAELDAVGLVAWCRENMANYKVPRHVEFVASLPTNAAGKVQKFQLR